MLHVYRAYSKFRPVSQDSSMATGVNNKGVVRANTISGPTKVPTFRYRNHCPMETRPPGQRA